MANFSAAARGLDPQASEAEFLRRFPGQNTAPVPFWDALHRGFVAQVEINNLGAREEGARQQLWARHRDIERRTGVKVPMSRFMTEGEDPQAGGFADNDLDFNAEPEAIERQLGLRPAQVLSEVEYEQRIDELRRKFPEAMAGVRTRAELDAARDQRLKAVSARAEEGFGSGKAPAVGSFAGGVLGSFVDPYNLMSMSATGAIGASRPLVQRMVVQGAVNAGTEVGQQPFRAIEARQFGGPEWTPGQAGADVLTATVAGAAFEAGGAGLKRLLGGKPPAGDAGPRIADLVDQAARDDAAIGPQDGALFEEGLDSLARAAPPPIVAPARDLADLPFAPAAELGGPEGAVLTARADYRGRPIYVGRFDPRALEADPGRFQYKADGDGQGVTARLRGVEAWDATASGKVVAWEDEGGRLFVADGHQRRGLALRMLDQGWEDVALDGHLFRAADGWTARQVRTVAALKNIREGSGTILDAAKVLRDAPEAAADKSLPVTGEFMAQARALARLSPDAFRAVVNKVVPERYGAEIGAIAGDRPDLHEGMVRLLKEGGPANGDEARAMVVEALQDDWIRAEGDQVDLFGYDPSISAMAARAKVAASVKRALSRDAKLFGGLIRHADAIEAGGNALARDANEARLAVDRAALELTAKLALRSGPIGEAMAEAAARVVKGATPADAAKGVTQRLRAALKAGERLDELRGVAIAPEPPSPAARSLVEAFDDPAGKAAGEQLAPKPEDAALEAADPARDAPDLFGDIMPEVGAEARAHQRLIQCAPGM